MRTVRRLLIVLLLAACTDDEPPAAVEDVVSGPETSFWDENGKQRSNKWSVETVDDSAVGTSIRMVIAPDGRVAFAYYSAGSKEDGPCEEIPQEEPPTRHVWPLYFAVEGAEDGVWERELIMEQLRIDNPVGLDLIWPDGGNPMIATQTGEPLVQIFYCGVNDLSLYTRSAPDTWAPEVAIVDSGEAVTGEAGSDYGYVVGHWPSLALDADGEPAIAYKDVHAGSVQTDDFNRADLEIARRSGGAWTTSAADIGRGAGDFTDLAFGSDGRPVIVHGNPTTDALDSGYGLWVTRLLKEEDQPEGEPPDVLPDAAWERVKLFEGKVFERPSMVIRDSDDAIFVAYYRPGKGLPYVAELLDTPALSTLDAWNIQMVGDSGYDEGVHPSVALDADGNPAVAYYRCARIQAGIGNCSAGDDALVLSRRNVTEWTQTVVYSGGEGLCGHFPNLAFDPAGSPVVGFRCAEEIDDEFAFTVKVARRKAP